MSTPFKMNPGRGPMQKTGRGIPDTFKSPNVQKESNKFNLSPEAKAYLNSPEGQAAQETNQKLISSSPQSKIRETPTTWKDTLAKVGRTALAVGKTSLQQFGDMVSMDPEYLGRNEGMQATGNKNMENLAHQQVIDQAKDGRIYEFAGKLAKSNQDPGYARRNYKSDKDYNKAIRSSVSQGKKAEKWKALTEAQRQKIIETTTKQGRRWFTPGY